MADHRSWHEGCRNMSCGTCPRVCDMALSSHFADGHSSLLVAAIVVSVDVFIEKQSCSEIQFLFHLTQLALEPPALQLGLLMCPGFSLECTLHFIDSNCCCRV